VQQKKEEEGDVIATIAFFARLCCNAAKEEEEEGDDSVATVTFFTLLRCSAAK
jgi:hypothetical protein